MEPIDRERLLSADQAKDQVLGRERRKPAPRVVGTDSDLEKDYGRGEGYVSQSRSAQKDFERRQKRLFEKFDKERTAVTGKATDEGRYTDNIHLSDAQRERLDRRLGKGDNNSEGPDRQPPAPGGGRTRSQ